MMIEAKAVRATIPAKDLSRARDWYAEKLGLKPTEEGPGGLYYDVGQTRFFLFETPYAGTAQNTAAGMEVEDLDRTVADLRENGVIFEEFDSGDFKTVNGIATLGDFKAAWFRDSEDNIIALSEE